MTQNQLVLSNNEKDHNYSLENHIGYYKSSLQPRHQVVIYLNKILKLMPNYNKLDKDKVIFKPFEAKILQIEFYIRQLILRKQSINQIVFVLIEIVKKIDDYTQDQDLQKSDSDFLNNIITKSEDFEKKLNQEIDKFQQDQPFHTIEFTQELQEIKNLLKLDNSESNLQQELDKIVNRIDTGKSQLKRLVTEERPERLNNICLYKNLLEYQQYLKNNQLDDIKSLESQLQQIEQIQKINNQNFEIIQQGKFNLQVQYENEKNNMQEKYQKELELSQNKNLEKIKEKIEKLEKSKEEQEAVFSRLNKLKQQSINITLIIDNSGSMRDHLQKINHSIKNFFDKIKKYVNDKTFITILYFNDETEVKCLQEIIYQTDSIDKFLLQNVKGGTQYLSAFNTVFQILEKSKNHVDIQKLIFFTDGEDDFTQKDQLYEILNKLVQINYQKLELFMDVYGNQSEQGKTHLQQISEIINKKDWFILNNKKIDSVQYSNNFDQVEQFFQSLASSFDIDLKYIQNSIKNIEDIIKSLQEKQDEIKDQTLKNIIKDQNIRNQINNLQNEKQNSNIDIINMLKCEQDNLNQQKESLQKKIEEKYIEIKKNDDQEKIFILQENLKTEEDQYNILKENIKNLEIQITKDEKELGKKKEDNIDEIYKFNNLKAKELNFSDTYTLIQFSKVLDDLKEYMTNLDLEIQNNYGYIRKFYYDYQGYIDCIKVQIKNDKKQEYDETIQKQIQDDDKQDALARAFLRHIEIDDKKFTEEQVKIICLQEDDLKNFLCSKEKNEDQFQEFVDTFIKEQQSKIDHKKKEIKQIETQKNQEIKEIQDQISEIDKKIDQKKDETESKEEYKDRIQQLKQDKEILKQQLKDLKNSWKEQKEDLNNEIKDYEEEIRLPRKQYGRAVQVIQNIYRKWEYKFWGQKKQQKLRSSSEKILQICNRF